MATIILGGGIIGLSTAYYLSEQKPSQPIHIIDSAPELLLSASGFAGGFLAKDWFSSDVAELGELSFRLHRELADKYDGHRKWGYAPSTAYSLSIETPRRRGRKTKRRQPNSDWLSQGSSRAEVAGQIEDNSGSQATSDGALRHELLNADGSPAWITQQEDGTLQIMSSEHGCAQVEPRELCEWLMQECSSRGVELSVGWQALRLNEDDAGRVNGITVRSKEGEQSIACSSLILASGAWTAKLFTSLFPNSKLKIPITHLAGYSVVVRSPRYSRPIVKSTIDAGDITKDMCHSVFYSPGPDWSYSPEAISRMPQSGKPEIYVAGLNDRSMQLPSNASGVKELIDEVKLQDLHRTTVLLTGLLQSGDDITEDDLEIVRHGLCFRPISRTGRPIVTRLSPGQLGREVANDEKLNVFVAAGHGPWGISLSLGTGLVVAQMVHGLQTEVDIAQLAI